MKLGIDIDDCLCYTMESFISKIKEVYGVYVPIDVLRGGSAKVEDYGYLTKNQTRELLSSQGNDGTILSLQAIPGAVDVVNRLHKNEEVVLITSRDQYDQSRLRLDTEMWLSKVGLGYDKLIFSDNKEKIVRQEGIDLMIDDSLSFIQQAIRGGTKAIIFARPWNENPLSILGEEGMKSVVGRCHSWFEIEALTSNLN